MTTFTRPTNPTGFSDDEGNWISQAEWIARYVLPVATPAQREAIKAMAQGYILVQDGKTKKTTLQRGDEVLPLRRALPEGITESAGQVKTRGPEDMMGYRKTYTTYKERLNGHAMDALRALGWI